MRSERTVRTKRFRFGRFSGAIFLPLCLAIFCSTFASSQQEARPGEAPPASPSAVIRPDAGPGQAGRFYDKARDFHFDYPTEMQVLDPNVDIETGHKNLYGESGSKDPEHQEAKRCTLPVLDVALPDNYQSQRMASITAWVDDSKEYKETRKAEPIIGKIFVTEVLRECLPKDMRKNDNDILGNMAGGMVSLPGIRPLSDPLWYDIGKQKVHMNSGLGRPIVNGRVALAPVLIMSMATDWHHHLLEWIFISNDTQTFNEILKSVVQFGNGSWATMFPGEVGDEGLVTNMKMAPK